MSHDTLSLPEQEKHYLLWVEHPLLAGWRNNKGMPHLLAVLPNAYSWANALQQCTYRRVLIPTSIASVSQWYWLRLTLLSAPHTHTHTHTHTGWGRSGSLQDGGVGWLPGWGSGAAPWGPEPRVQEVHLSLPQGNSVSGPVKQWMTGSYKWTFSCKHARGWKHCLILAEHFRISIAARRWQHFHISEHFTLASIGEALHISIKVRNTRIDSVISCSWQSNKSLVWVNVSCFPVEDNCISSSVYVGVMKCSGPLCSN